LENKWAAVFWMATLSVATVSYVVIIGRLLMTALRTGRLQSRGRVYDRSTQPGRYWLLTITFSAVGVVLVLLTLVFTRTFIHSFS
jgi:hypothetical protein